MTTDQPMCNTSSHCSLCLPTLSGVRNWVRVRIGDPHGANCPRIAVCPVHDIAGPVAALPISMRAAMERDSA